MICEEVFGTTSVLGRISSFQEEVVNVCGLDHLAAAFDLSWRRIGGVVVGTRHPVLVATAPGSKNTGKRQKADYQ